MLRLTLFGSFKLARAGGEDVPVTSRKARALLAYLALSPGQSRSREEIMALLWSERAESQARGSLRQVLSGLRKDLGEALRIDKDKVALNPGQIALSEAREGDLLAGFHLNDPAFEEWLRDERLRFDGLGEAPAGSRDGTPEIAVLPFDTLSEDKTHQVFSDGLTEDIVAELSRFTSLVVYSPWSSFAYAEEDDKTTEQIGLDLEVDYIVEGSVRHSGDRVRITAMLFDLETVNHVWVQRYDRDLGDVFAVQDEVARDVATAVTIRIDADLYDRATRRAGRDLTALDYVLLGERAQQQDWNASEAAELYEKAIAADPECARAYANLANWHANSGFTLFVPLDEARRRARELGEKALNLTPNAAIVLAILADAYAAVGDFELSRQCLEKATKQNPNNHGVMGFAASTLPWLGDVEGALIWLERYLRHDPLWQTAAMEVSFEVYYMAGRFEEAVASIARLTDLPLHLLPLSAAAHAQCGRMEEAAELRRRYEEGLPEGRTFEEHIVKPILLCTDQALIDLWLDGFRKAGFEI